MKRVLILVFLAAWAPAQDNLHFAADRPFDLEHLSLEAKVDLKKRTLAGEATLSMTALRPGRVIRLDAVGLEISGVTVLRGEPKQAVAGAAFSTEAETLEITLPQPVPRGERLAVKVRYVCHDPPFGLRFFGPTRAEPDVPYQAWSQGETIATRYWIPIFDHPNERLTSELRIAAGPGLQVLSNGRLVSTKDGVWHWKQETDHVPYLISLVVGKFAVITETWRGKTVDYWVPPDRKEDAMRSFGNTKRMLDFFSDTIGLEYPWPKYTQIVVEQFSHGGMENTTATTLNERTLHDEKAHVDFRSDGLVAHELAHQWFGDLLTCREWAHTWLNEGFATYYEALWHEFDLGREEFFLNMWHKASSARNGGKKLPIVHRAYVNSWDQFDSRAYPKGAWVLHMLRRRLGDETFHKAIYHYVTKHAHDCVETADLRRALEEATGEALGRFFHDWTERPGHPVLHVQHRWIAKDKVMAVRVRQTQKAEAFHFPLRIEYGFSGERKPLGITHDVAVKDLRLHVPLPERPRLVRVDPRYALLTELTEDKSRDYWVRQLGEDENPVARIRAAEWFGRSRRDADRRVLADALGRERFWGVQAEIAKALGRSGGDVSRDVLLQALSLPNAKARRAVVEALGKFRDDETVTSALEGIVSKGDASYSVEEAAIRAWAARRPPNALARLRPLLEVDSHREAIRTAALEGLGEQRDTQATELLLGWTAAGKPRPCRRTALQALGKLARSAVWDGATQAKVVQVLARHLGRDEAPGIKRAAIQSLRDLGELAEPAMNALEVLGEHDPNENVRKDAKEAIEKIRSGAPARLELQRLREELRKLREADRNIRDRLDRMARKTPEPVGTDGKG